MNRNTRKGIPTSDTFAYITVAVILGEICRQWLAKRRMCNQSMQVDDAVS